MIKKLYNYIFKKNKKSIFKKQYIDTYYNILSSHENKVKTKELLLIELKKNGVTVEYINEYWILGLVGATRHKNSGLTNIQDDLISKIDDSFDDLFKFSDAMIIYSICLRAGLFKIAYYLRIYFENKYIENYKTVRNKNANIKDAINSYSFDKIEILIKILLERREFKYLYELMQYVSNKNNDNNAVTAVRVLLSTLNSKHMDNPSSDTIKDEFHKFILGTSVAVVGPAKTDIHSAKDIDSHDVVLRMNYKEKENGTDPFIKGERCDISNFNIKQINSLVISNGNYINWPDKISWVSVNSSENIVKMRSYLYDKLLDKNKMMPKFRCRDNRINHLCSHTKYTQLPKILFDLLQFNPKSVKVYHADLMITVDRSKGYVPEDWKWDDMYVEFLRISSKLHDPIPQFRLLKLYIDNKCITGDKRFLEVLNLSEEQYMIELQNIYGNSGRTLTQNRTK